MEATFVHLRVHSEYSLVDGLVRVKPLVKQVAQYPTTSPASSPLSSRSKEFLQHDCRLDKLGGALLALLDDTDRRQRIADHYLVIHRRPGAAASA